MDEQLAQLRDIDQEMTKLLKKDEVDAEEILQLVDKREQLLQGLLDYASNNHQFAISDQWRDAIASTQQLVEQMEMQTMRFGNQLRRFRHGKRSVQQYKKFL